MSRHVDRKVRTDEVLYILEDSPSGNVHYTGRTNIFGGATSDDIWQIKRTYRVGNLLITDFADYGKYNCVWDNRATYFAAAASGQPYIGQPLLDELGFPFSPSNPLDVVSSFSGLRNGGLITEQGINAVTWTALPTVNLVGRNAICIQNNSVVEIKMNYRSNVVGYVGIVIPAQSERFYDITDAISIYAKASAGTPTITVEEIS